jgi:uncharacterized protein YycO
MKKNFVYVLSALFVASVLMVQVPAQAVTSKTTDTYTKTVPHTKKTLTGKTKKDLMKKKVTVTTETKTDKKEVPLKDKYKKY